MFRRKYVQNGLVAAVAAMAGAAHFMPGTNANGPVLTAAVTFVRARPVALLTNDDETRTVMTHVQTALEALKGSVRPLSHHEALEDAFRSYFAYKAAHPDDVRKPLLYFVDYGLPSTTARGYVFNMDDLSIVDGPFTVAHGRGSSVQRDGVPTRFSNVSGSAATSLGLYVAQELYSFVGHAGGGTYSSTGLRLRGVSEGFNDNARARGVVAHGAPYVTRTGSGRSEGCPAMEQDRARRLLPELANGAMVFLFAPNQDWMSRDQWLTWMDSQRG